MLEAYTTLGFIAGLTKRARLSVMVTGVTYRHPGILAKTVTALDVLSGGRAMLGIGAAWNEREHLGLGVPFPPLKERFERLEETLQIVHQMWSENNGPYEGKHYQLAETLNLPPAVQQPHPPILIGGSGGPKNLRLVARYADACNIFGAAEALRERFALLKELCAEEGRDYDAIERTAGTPLDLGKKGGERRRGRRKDRWTGGGRRPVPGCGPQGSRRARGIGDRGPRPDSTDQGIFETGPPESRRSGGREPDSGLVVWMRLGHEERVVEPHAENDDEHVGANRQPQRLPPPGRSGWEGSPEDEEGR